MRLSDCSQLCLLLVTLASTCRPAPAQDEPTLLAKLNDSGEQILVYRSGSDTPILTQEARPDFRPYLHPIVAPDGKGLVTEFSPGHHKHQTGLYWGFTRLNGRDYFHHPEGSHWKRVSVSVLNAEAASPNDSVQWQTVYDLLDEAGQAVLQETQTWTMTDHGDSYTLDLHWNGEAKTDVTIGKYDYGGLFLRMPWQPGIPGRVMNSARQEGLRAEGQRAVWLDVGMQVEGRDDPVHVAIFDHPKNAGFPQPWRVDGQLGVGPVRARMGDWKIAKDQKETIRHQVVIFTGELDDVAVTERWSEFSGQRMAWAQWQLAQQEGRRAEFLTPEKAVESMTLQEGFEAGVYASEPMITQPMAFCWDDRGRIWVAENRDYESRGDGFSNDGNSRILILEDTDRDGVADSRTVFLEGIPFPAAIAVGMGGLWLGAPPNLLFVPDRDGDDKADMDEIEVRLTGWGIRDRHETLNSLHWGPDGWLYGCQGFATPSKVGKPEGEGRLYGHKDAFPKEIRFDGDPVDINGGVWRYHPISQQFEVVAHGFSNPWGLDYDAHGQLFITACVIPHLWHVIPGGIYHRQGGSHFNSHVYSDIQTIADHRHRSAHGGARVYLSDAFPEKYHGRIFMANIHEHAVLTDILTPRGSGFVGQHGDEFALANNAQWIGFSTEIGPDGSVYILDWHDADICGKDVLNKETGRIFRFTASASAARDFEGRYADLNTLTDLQLAKLQLQKSAWHARRARVILQHRASTGELDYGTVDALKALLSADTTVSLRLRALWTLHVTESLSDAELTTLLNDPEPYVRGWAIQLLCEDRAAPDAAVNRFVRMAADDSSPVVRLYLASALQRLPEAAGWEIASHLVAHEDDADDHNIPKMIWFGLEPTVVPNPQRALDLATSSRIPMLTRHIARRLTYADQFEPLVAAIRTAGPAQLHLLLGMRDGLDGRYDVEAPSSWTSVYNSLRAAGGETSRLALQLSQQFGDTVAATVLLGTVQDPKTPRNDRLDALRGLVGRQRPEIKPVLLSLLDDNDLRTEAIRAMAAFDDETLADALLQRYDTFSASDKLEVVHTLSARSSSGWKLTQAIKNEMVPRRDIPAYVARLLRRVVGNGFVEVWGTLDGLSADGEALITRYRELLSDEALADANASRGRVLFNRTCAACHRLHGYGGITGPDITGANRTNLEYLLGNILTPSAIIQDAYRMHIVVTDDGRVYSGIPAAENDRQLSLRVANREAPVTINKSQIESRDIAPVSMMPEGLLTTLQDEEVVDLIAYLQSLKQVPLEK
ncbi:MAG: PmoA family protein [Fuerstiella sp.]